MHFHSLLSWNCRPEGNSSLRWIYSMCDWKWNDPMMAFTRWRWRDDLSVTISQRKLTIRYKKKNKSIVLPLLLFFWCRQDAFMGIWRSSTGPLRIIWTMWMQTADDSPDSSVNIFIMAANSLVLSCASEGVSEGGQKTRLNGCGYIMNWVASMVVVSQRH